MREIYFGDLRVYVRQHIKQIEAANYELDSIEWFLLRYLRRLVSSMESDSSPGRVEGSMRSLVRFYVDNIDEKSELGDKCMKIYDEYRKTLRSGQTKKNK
ncbi:MAG: hypothetical protein GKR93_05325 [Gammaproteobacteria bacterium]|nr:hypothetical protein [Gammaproteobacteria bacterium]